MIIKDPILSPYEIRVDDNNHTVFLNTGRLNKENEVVYNTVGYFSNVPACINFIAKKKILDENKNATIMLSDYASELKEIHQKLNNCLTF